MASSSLMAEETKVQQVGLKPPRLVSTAQDIFVGADPMPLSVDLRVGTPGSAYLSAIPTTAHEELDFMDPRANVINRRNTERENVGIEAKIASATLLEPSGEEVCSEDEGGATGGNDEAKPIREDQKPTDVSQPGKPPLHIKILSLAADAEAKTDGMARTSSRTSLALDDEEALSPGGVDICPSLNTPRVGEDRLPDNLAPWVAPWEK